MDKLTPTQTRALELIRREGTLYAYNGVSIATVRVLERLDLITVVESSVQTWTNRRSGRSHSQADWAVKIK